MMTLVPRVGPARTRTGASGAFSAFSRRFIEPRSSRGGTTIAVDRGGKGKPMRARQQMGDFAAAKSASLRGKRATRAGAALTESERAGRNSTGTPRKSKRGPK